MNIQRVEEIYSLYLWLWITWGPTVPVIIIFIASVAFLVIKIFIVCVKTKKDSLGRRRILDIAYESVLCSQTNKTYYRLSTAGALVVITV